MLLSLLKSFVLPRLDVINVAPAIGSPSQTQCFGTPELLSLLKLNIRLSLQPGVADSFEMICAN